MHSSARPRRTVTCRATCPQIPRSYSDEAQRRGLIVPKPNSRLSPQTPCFSFCGSDATSTEVIVISGVCWPGNLEPSQIRLFFLLLVSIMLAPIARRRRGLARTPYAAKWACATETGDAVHARLCRQLVVNRGAHTKMTSSPGVKIDARHLVLF